LQAIAKTMVEKAPPDAPPPIQPKPEDLDFDLDGALKSVVTLQANIPDDAFTAPILGTERAGNGVVIGESGLVLTIGYLIAEAESVWVTDFAGRVVPAHALAYDQETGFGVVQTLGKLELPALGLGAVKDAKIGDSVTVVGGGPRLTVGARIIGKQEFAGHWEYLLDEAMFTAPAHPFWGGAGVIGRDGRLLGIGSLHVQHVTERGRQQDINMIVPIDLLPPILDDLLAYGRVNKPARPWLGVYSGESGGRIIVANVAARGPAAAAGLREGDIISAVRDSSIEGLADFYRKIWQCGPAGVEIPIEVVRDQRSFWLRIKSADRNSFLRKPRLQ
jgi:S1-C subfamily serine protease